MNTTTTKKPVSKIKLAGISAAIWKTDTDKGSVFNVTFDRVYRSNSGDFKNTGSFRARDLLTLAKLADLAHTTIAELSAAPDADETED